jgi:hypothetical protein
LLGPLVEDLVALRAKGYLPLTRSMRRLVRVGRVGPGIALVVGPLVAVAGGALQWIPLVAAGIAIFILAMPVGMLVNWRLEPHGELRRINGALIVKLTNVHPNFAAAEEKSQREALDQGKSPPAWHSARHPAINATN